MADYYPLIARAIAGLDPSAPGESRRALYERARSALIAQLRSVEPPLSESEITRERLSLEEAVRKVESEAAQRARDLPRSDGKPRAGDAFRNNNPRGNARAIDPADASPRGRQPITPSPREPAAARSEEPRSARTLRVDPPPIPRQQPAAGLQDPAPSSALPPTRERTGSPRRFDNNTPPPPPAPGAAAMRGFRDVTADVDDLGRAAAQANRAARKTYANVPSPTPEFDRLEPTMEDRGEVFGYDESVAEEPAPPPSRIREPKAKKEKPPKPVKPPKPKRVSGGFPVKTAVLIGLVMILIGAGILAGPKLWQTVRGLGSTAPVVVDSSKDAPLAPRPKIADRVGQPSTSEQLAPVAQRVVLYDEDPAEPKGKQYVGTVVWRTEQIKASGGKPGDIAVRADIEIPERKLKMTMSFRRNTDTSLPASHTAELTFVLPSDFSGGGVANVPGVLMKSNEQARGTPLAGLAVKVTDGFFLVGLSNVESDRVRNLQLLKERSWFDIPLVYSNQRRAIIAIEKGSPGERAFNDAFAAWGE
ncbi:hypothetical protein [Tardiphaga sp.]|uniref:hypothetical protein n=1 Tax=Tardiphaga sp. TaxID=1926292 RepID=UPI00260B8071|nr:hypothetical protein [Tardiphaga sp.]MDB5620049.1 hypothetical protein [Tardiphaga sp.]